MNLKLDIDILEVLDNASAPLPFADLRVALRGKYHHVDFRVVDRALQRLRKSGAVRYQRSKGTKATHGWVRGTPGEPEGGRP